MEAVTDAAIVSAYWIISAAAVAAHLLTVLIVGSVVAFGRFVLCRDLVSFRLGLGPVMGVAGLASILAFEWLIIAGHLVDR